MTTYVSTCTYFCFTRLEGSAAGEKIDLIIDFDCEYDEDGRGYRNEYNLVEIRFDVPKGYIMNEEGIEDLGGPLTPKELAAINEWFDDNVATLEEAVIDALNEQDGNDDYHREFYWQSRNEI